MENNITLKKQILEISRLMHKKGFVAGTDGNISVLCEDNSVLITASKINKGFITLEDILTVDLKGKVLEGSSKCSTELAMHLKVYSLRKDLSAVIHAHPPYVVAYSVAGIDLSSRILPEAVLVLKDIHTSEYSRPCSKDNVKIIEKYILKTDAIVLKRHGTLSCGKNLIEAYSLLEKLEHTAKVGVIANSLSKINLIDNEEYKLLLKESQELNSN
jgi:L-fuculose-phosphate aldolase